MSDVTLSADEHFEALREAVWARVRSRPGRVAWERFEDAYSEWWTREVERAAAGRPSRAASPVAFVAEAVHRVLIDERRARARGLARGEEKAALEVVDLDDQLDVASVDDVPDAAHYEAVVHRILHLVRERLTTRELRVFVFSFLYLRTSEQTAAALGLSVPRVKKDRKRVATKVGEEVWAVLSAELSCSAAYSDKGLLGVCEVLVDHADECPECAAAIRGVRRGALAVLSPVELLALGDEPVHLFDVLTAKLMGPVHRAAEVATSMPAGGRAAAVAALAATAVGGGVAVRAAPEAPAARAARPTPVVTVAPPVATPPVAAIRSATAEPAERPRRPRRTAAPRRETFVSATPTPQPVQVIASPTTTPVAQEPSAPHSGGEFGFEQP